LEDRQHRVKASLEAQQRYQSQVASISGRIDTGELPDAAGQPPLEQQSDASIQDNDKQAEYSWTKYMEYDITKLFISRIGSKGLKLLRNLEIIFPRIGPTLAFPTPTLLTKNSVWLLSIWLPA
jgi:hypothetical protein